MAKIDPFQVEAGKHLIDDTKKLIKRLTEQQRQSIGAAFKKIGNHEVKRTKNRLEGRGGLAKMVAKTNSIESKFTQSRSDNTDMGTISFGAFQEIQGKGRWKSSTRTGEPINIAAVLMTGSPKDGKPKPVGLYTEGQKKRGIIYGGNHPDIKKYVRHEIIKEGKVTRRIPEEKEFLEKAQSNILRDLEATIPKLIEDATKKIRDGPKRN